MLISEIVLTESYDDDLLNAVKDLLTRVMSKDIKKIKTEKPIRYISKFESIRLPQTLKLD